MSSFEQEKKLEQLITNDTTPTMSTIDILSSLKLINHFESRSGDDTASQKIANEELKYLRAGMGALQSNPSLTSRFGSGWQGAMAVAGLLKQKQSERVYDKIIGDILEANESLKLDTVVGALNRGGARAIGDE
jgi:hypothetical protein